MDIIFKNVINIIILVVFLTINFKWGLEENFI